MLITDGYQGPDKGVTVSLEEKHSRDPYSSSFDCVQITYRGGEACGSVGNRVSVLKIDCDESIDPGVITNVIEADTCTVNIFMSSKYLLLL